MYLALARFWAKPRPTPGAAFGGEQRGASPWDEMGLWRGEAHSALSTRQYKADSCVGVVTLCLVSTLKLWCLTI